MTDGAEGEGRGDGSPPIDSAALDRLLEWGGPALQEKMIDLFLENAPERMQSIRTGIDTGDLDSAERAAHSMKSSAGNLGADRLQEFARRVEELLEVGNRGGAGEVVPEMEEELRKALDALREVRRG